MQMNTSVQRKQRLPQFESHAAIQSRIESLTARRVLPASTRSLRIARTLCGISLALTQAVERLCAVLPLAQDADPQAVEFGCGTAAGVKGRITIVDGTAVISLIYLSSRVSADSLTEFWRQLGHVLERHKRMTFLRNKKVGLRLHLSCSEVEEQLRRLAARAAVEATSVLDSIDRHETLAHAKKRDSLPLFAPDLSMRSA